MLKSKIESLLFISAKPFSIKKLIELTGAKKEEVEESLELLMEEYKDKGIRLIKLDKNYQLSTCPDNAELVQKYLKDETTGELTRPALETLTIIAYRGPIAKLELEQIRGVNCGQILRNLRIRGLVESREDKRIDDVFYNITMGFMKFLGISDVNELSDYDKLNKDKNLEDLLGKKQESTEEKVEKEVQKGS